MNGNGTNDSNDGSTNNKHAGDEEFGFGDDDDDVGFGGFEEAAVITKQDHIIAEPGEQEQQQHPNPQEDEDDKFGGFDDGGGGGEEKEVEPATTPAIEILPTADDAHADDFGGDVDLLQQFKYKIDIY
jgi:hypothetical protein